MKKMIISLFTLCLLTSCEVARDYNIPTEVRTMAISRFEMSNGLFYKIIKTSEITETPIIGSKKYYLYIETEHRSAEKAGEIFIYEYKKSGDSYEYIGTSKL